MPVPDETLVVRAMARVLCATRAVVLDQPEPRVPCTHCCAQAALIVGQRLHLVRVTEAKSQYVYHPL